MAEKEPRSGEPIIKMMVEEASEHWGDLVLRRPYTATTGDKRPDATDPRIERRISCANPPDELSSISQSLATELAIDEQADPTGRLKDLTQTLSAHITQTRWHGKRLKTPEGRFSISQRWDLSYKVEEDVALPYPQLTIALHPKVERVDDQLRLYHELLVPTKDEQLEQYRTRYAFDAVVHQEHVPLYLQPYFTQDLPADGWKRLPRTDAFPATKNARAFQAEQQRFAHYVPQAQIVELFQRSHDYVLLLARSLQNQYLTLLIVRTERAQQEVTARFQTAATAMMRAEIDKRLSNPGSPDNPTILSSVDLLQGAYNQARRDKWLHASKADQFKALPVMIMSYIEALQKATVVKIPGELTSQLHAWRESLFAGKLTRPVPDQTWNQYLANDQTLFEWHTGMDANRFPTLTLSIIPTPEQLSHQERHPGFPPGPKLRY